MADTKITSLQPPQAGYPVVPATDVLPIVVIADPGMATSGSTRKVTVNQLLGAGGTATLASATITGALGAAGLNVTGATIPANGVYLGSANNLSFSAASTLAMTLNSTGLGVGVASPAAKLDVFGNAALTGTSGFKYLYFNLATDTNSVRGAKIGKNYDSPYELNIHATTSASGLSNEAAIKFYRNLTDVSMTLDSTGNVGIGVTPSGSGGCLQLKSGITFPATQVASSDANTLDDYEEGTWTPTIKGTSTAGTGTYSVQVGTYTKVGRVVYFQGRITWSAHTGTGDMQIAGIPFTALSTTNSNSTCNFGYVNNLSLAASSVLTGFVFPGTNDIGLYQYTAGGGVASTVAIDTAADIMFSGFYFV
jgi:hypothetical protein